MSEISLLKRFPSGLIEKVVDAIPPGDVDGLKVLSTVAQILLPLCQKRLFGTVTISTAIQKAAKKGSKKPGKSLASKFLDVLKDSSHLALYTTRLDITINWHENPVSQRAIIQQVLAIYNSFDTVLNLKRLSLGQEMPSDLGVRAPKLREEVVKILKMKSLVHVELKDIPIDIIHHLSPSVRHLALWNPLLEDDERKRGQWQSDLKSITTDPISAISAHSPSSENPARLKLESLLVDDAVLTRELVSGDRNAHTLNWLVEQRDKLDFTGLKRLRVGLTACEALEAHQALAALVSLCANSLEEWSFTPALDADEKDFVDPVTLANLPSLKYLHLGVQTVFFGPSDSDTIMVDGINWVYSRLCSAPQSNNKVNNNKDKDKNINNTNAENNNIKTLVISSSFSIWPTEDDTADTSTTTNDIEEENFNSKPYVDLGDLLEKRPKFPCLERVSFHIEKAPYYKDCMSVSHFGQNIRKNMGTWSTKMEINTDKYNNYTQGLRLDNEWK